MEGPEDPTAAWSLEAGRDAFVEVFGPDQANYYATRVEYAQQLFGEQAQEAIALQPTHSNDLLLHATVEDLVERLPQALARAAAAVYVGRIDDPRPNAFALREDAPDTRLVLLHSSLSHLLAVYAALSRALNAELLNGPRDFETIDAVMDAAFERVATGRAGPRIYQLLELRDRWRADGFAMLDTEDRDVLKDDGDRIRGAYAVSTLLDVAEHFVIGHELAHHLLGHTATAPTGSYPAQAALDGYLEQRGLAEELAALGSSKRQQAELDADVFGFLTMTGELAGLHQKPDWYWAIGGALLALPALEDLEGYARAARRPDGATGRALDDYPRTEDRFALLGTLVLRAWPEPDEDPDHPFGYLVQQMLYRRVVTAPTGAIARPT